MKITSLTALMTVALLFLVPTVGIAADQALVSSGFGPTAGVGCSEAQASAGRAPVCTVSTIGPVQAPMTFVSREVCNCEARTAAKPGDTEGYYCIVQSVWRCHKGVGSQRSVQHSSGPDR